MRYVNDEFGSVNGSVNVKSMNDIQKQVVASVKEKTLFLQA